MDVEKLRSEGYADVLRGVYHQMAADPNSLSNLDQDLPNYLQYFLIRFVMFAVDNEHQTRNSHLFIAKELVMVRDLVLTGIEG